MSQFFEELWGSIFTPGPTPTLLVATNASFAALQMIFLALLVATSSIHFVILSVLCGGLWVSINWFAREIQASKEMEEARRKDRAATTGGDGANDSGDETEDARDETKARAVKSAALDDDASQRAADLRKRRSLAESGTDSEWDKVESEVEMEAKMGTGEQVRKGE